LLIMVCFNLSVVGSIPTGAQNWLRLGAHRSAIQQAEVMEGQSHIATITAPYLFAPGHQIPRI